MEDSRQFEVKIIFEELVEFKKMFYREMVKPVLDNFKKQTEALNNV